MINYISGENNSITNESPEVEKKIQITFKGSNNTIKIGKNLKINNSNLNINITGNNNIVEIGDSNIINRGLNIVFYVGGVGTKSNNCSIKIGNDNFFNGSNINLNCGEENTHITIENDCLFAGGVLLTTTDNHAIYDLSTKKRINLPGNINLGNKVWVCQGVTILNHSSVGDDVVIGTKSLVTSCNSPNNCVIAGIPAKIIRTNTTWTRECSLEDLPVGKSSKNFEKQSEQTQKIKNIKKSLCKQLKNMLFNPLLKKKAFFLCNNGMYLEAETIVSNIITNNPYISWAYYILAKIQWEKGLHFESLENLNKAISLDPNVDYYQVYKSSKERIIANKQKK